MITGLDPNATQDFVSKYDQGEPKTVWKLGVLTARAYAYVGSKMSDPKESVNAMIEIVRFGLRGFSTFKDKDNNDVKFTIKSKDVYSETFNVVSDHIISIIPVDCIVELGSKILEITKLQENEVKNSQ